MSSNEITFYNLDKKTQIVPEFATPLMFYVFVNSEEKEKFN